MADFHQRVERLSEAQRRALLAQLDEPETPAHISNRRDMPRLPFRRTHVAVTITQPGGGSIACTVPTRDLSTGGLSFIYWGFLYKGTHIQCSLSRLRGAVDLLESTVSWCKLIGGTNHLIGVRFKHRIEPELYIEQDAGAVRTRALDPRTLRGSVLVVAQNELDRRLLSHFLKQTPLDFVCVESLDLAAQIAGRRTLNLILCDLDLPDGTGEQAVVAMRLAGFEGAFLALTAESDPERHRRAREAGAAAILQKPFVESALLREIARWLNREGTATEPPLHSELSGKGLDDLITSFVVQARQWAQEARSLMTCGDRVALRRLCTTIRGNGGSYGFPAVTEAATEAVAAIDGTEDINSALIPVRRLCHVLSRLIPPAAAA